MSTYFFSRHHNPARRRLVLRGVAANATAVLPKGSAVRRVFLHNRNATAAVTGGIRIGTAAGGSQVTAATAVPADGLVDATVASSSLSKQDQTLYIEAATAFNGAVLDVVVHYDQVPFVDTEYQPGSLNLGPIDNSRAASRQ